MIHSMTGFGRGIQRTAAGGITVELRSVNHRFLEIVSHLPNVLQPFEDKAREMLRKQLQRGRVTCSATVQITRSRSTAQIDMPAAKRYYAQLKKLQRTLHIDEPISLEQVLTLPRVLVADEQPLAPTFRVGFERALTQALAALLRMRGREGGGIGRELLQRLRSVERHRVAIARQAPTVAKGHQERLARRMRELAPKGALDAQRLATEVAVFAENADITEELSRLQSHIVSVGQHIRQAGEQGRTLDFMSQEMLRETNTIGSKARDYNIAKDVIAIKGELEKMREQIQNVE